MIEVHIPVPPESVAYWTELCQAGGAQAVTLIPGENDPEWFREPGEPIPWKAPLLRCLVDDQHQARYLIRRLETCLQDHIDHWLVPVPDKDWIRESRNFFQPLLIHDTYWIRPPWQSETPDTRPALILEPGLAFGTGQHPTTRFLLDWLAMHPPVGKTVIDWGCGSGILGLAALLLGAKSCLGTDTDPQAWAASRANARLNNVTFPVYPPDQLPESKVDLILANILARPLMQLKSRFDAHLLPGGTLLLTGILASQIPAMEKTYAPDYTLTVETREKDWVLLTAIRQT